MNTIEKYVLEFEAALKRIAQLEVELADSDKAWRECGDRAEKAEAKIRRLRAALEEIAEGRFYCSDGDCRAIETAQSALSDEQPAESVSAIIKTLTNQHGQVFAVYLSDGQKVGIQREGGSAWLRIEDTPIVHAI